MHAEQARYDALHRRPQQADDQFPRDTDAPEAPSVRQSAPAKPMATDFRSIQRRIAAVLICPICGKKRSRANMAAHRKPVKLEVATRETHCHCPGSPMLIGGRPERPQPIGHCGPVTRANYCTTCQETVEPNIDEVAS